MRMKQVSLLVVLLASSSLTTVSLADVPTPSQGTLSRPQIGQVLATHANASQPKQAQSAKTVANISGFVDNVSQLVEFADWKQAQAVFVRTLYDPSGHQNSLLWKVVFGAEDRGYFVTTLDGSNVFEYSHRAVPQVPESLQSKMVDNGYLYAGPMLHLAYIHGLDGLELYNLLTGETLPNGELQNGVPHLQPLADETNVQGERVERLLKRSTTLEDDALYATGLFGKYKLGNQKDVQPLKEYVKGDAFEKPAFVVYDAIPNKMTVPLAMTKIVKQGTTTYVGLQDPFAETAEEKLPVYIDSRFPVFVVPVNVPPNTSSAT
jgi:hypothetical protein